MPAARSQRPSRRASFVNTLQVLNAQRQNKLIIFCTSRAVLEALFSDYQVINSGTLVSVLGQSDRCLLYRSTPFSTSERQSLERFSSYHQIPLAKYYDRREHLGSQANPIVVEDFVAQPGSASNPIIVN